MIIKTKNMSANRRDFLKKVTAGAAGIAVGVIQRWKSKNNIETS